eukprot:TRINITY_DN16091_c1_g1_i3.p1 TRINITY_DN16091_c1_g1~~TRINITY_DN16091_c1_g1_i3.p1  ORF type:complete len:113 (+),score=3.73 TRINITY_DN16091_c1_g1_i3:286-624(+)
MGQRSLLAALAAILRLFREIKTLIILEDFRKIKRAHNLLSSYLIKSSTFNKRCKRGFSSEFFINNHLVDDLKLELKIVIALFSLGRVCLQSFTYVSVARVTIYAWSRLFVLN